MAGVSVAAGARVGKVVLGLGGMTELAGVPSGLVVLIGVAAPLHPAARRASTLTATNRTLIPFFGTAERTR
jgi:hypothetical protein